MFANQIFLSFPKLGRMVLIPMHMQGPSIPRHSPLQRSNYQDYQKPKNRRSLSAGASALVPVRSLGPLFSLHLFPSSHWRPFHLIPPWTPYRRIFPIVQMIYSQFYCIPDHAHHTYHVLTSTILSLDRSFKILQRLCRTKNIIVSQAVFNTVDADHRHRKKASTKVFPSCNEIVRQQEREEREPVDSVTLPSGGVAQARISKMINFRTVGPSADLYATFRPEVL